MAGTMKRTERRIWKGRIEETEEGRRLLANPAFVAALEQGRRSGPGIPVEESNRRAGITPEEWAAAQAELDRMEAEDAVQDRLLADQTARHE